MRMLWMTLIVVFLAGCGNMAQSSVEAQDRFIAAVNTLEARVDNAPVGAILVKPETLEAIAKVNDMRQDPTTWVALAGILGTAILGTNKYTKRNGS